MLKDMNYPTYLRKKSVEVSQSTVSVRYTALIQNDPDRDMDGEKEASEEPHLLQMEDTGPGESLKEDDGTRKTFWEFEPGLLRFKAFYFFFCGSIGALFPFMSLYFKQLGFSPNQIGIISGLRPVAGFCAAVIIGSLADRFQIRRLCLMTAVVCSLTIMTAVGFVPAAPVVESKCPPELHYTNSSSDFFEETGMQNKTASSEKTNIHINTSYIDTVNNSDASRHFLSKSYQEESYTLSEKYPKLLEDRGWMFQTDALYKIFIIILILVVASDAAMSPVGTLMETGCLAELGQDNRNKFGRQRAWSSLGLGAMSILAGSLVSTTRMLREVCGSRVVFSDYRISFILFAVCQGLCFFVAICFKFKKTEEHEHEAKEKPNPLKVFKMFFGFHFGSWLFCMLFMGICNGVIWGFLNWHLENLGGTQLMIGTATSVSLGSELIMFLLINPLLKRLGHTCLLCLGLVSYVIRFSVFAAITNPWYVLPTEVLQGMSFAVIWVVLIDYLCGSVPSRYLATVQGIMHGVYFGMGNGSGHMIAGILIEHFGAPFTFWVFAIASGFNVIIFCLAQKFSKKEELFKDYSIMTE